MHALVRLAWRRTAFHSATLALALLGEAENETWANNASNEFTARFEVFLGGTPVPYTERLSVIDEIVALDRRPLTRLAIKALSRVGNKHAMRWGSTPTLDAAPEPEWRPPTVGDWIECVEQALERLRRIAQNSPTELEGELVEAAGRLSMMLREDMVSGRVAAFLEAFRTAHPTAREPLRRQIAEVIFRERKYWHQLPAEELARLDALHARFEDASLAAQLRQRVGPGPWDQDAGTDQLHEFARSFAGDRDALSAEWPWLTSGEASDGWAFGDAMATADSHGALDDVLAGLPGRGRDLRVLCGYLVRRREARGAAWFDAWLLRTMAARPDDMPLLFEAGWRCGMTVTAARLIATAVREKRIAGPYTTLLENGPWPLTLPPESLDDMLDALSRHGYRPVAIAILYIRVDKAPEQLERLESLALDLVTSSEVIRNGATMTDFYWKEVALRLAPKHASAIAAAVFREQGDRTKETWFAEYSTAKEVLIRCVERDPAGVWRAMEPYLASAGAGIHFGIGFPLGLLDQMPPEEVLKWLSEDPEDRAAVLARLVSKNLTGDETLMARILGEFGDRPSIAGSFYSAYSSGSWTGSSSGHWAQLATELERVVRATRLPKLRAWAQETARVLRRQEERDLQREEEEALHDR